MQRQRRRVAERVHTPHPAAATGEFGKVGPVYDRWDARSQAIINRAGYIRRHKDCPSAPHPASVTEAVRPGPDGGGWSAIRLAASS